jgi:hypothetical protein
MPSYATAVQWIVPASGTIISGQGSTSLVVEFAGSTLATDSIKAMGVNACANSSQRKLKVTALAACRSAGNERVENIATTRNKSAVPIINNEFDITAMPNPSHHHFILQLTKTNLYDPVFLQVADATGRPIETKQHVPNTIVIGAAWKPGIYFVTFIQGSKKKNIRLVKL